ncbi:phosphoribosylformylglycinamidine synthase subunit PurL [Caldivirga maquilingensis]|uniref:Phosphoribosylformylglycinamidine synthase subunit PurL n=1 Tax=Caldivirga maquilingensis (strain ATCC 700844 / DSM 13496 / JCM 10307 / IC-167) TaxID=397948 RepID=PURL_CALMQ|nr:phosphoribosylformylglycinamidine synthase subunit PurL [Caldivirga maquilingensis]A8MCK2.1 RecName: Full=Phosphoribosylformylglycinamidine synthase subunit PurL; Short=FGAM synthase; AltName: Full=Formylglycinamide ribonucleotide amidotransferase subunit II; Short=FGAR amidotransferase II; Short=FGAR-AT II; AltName: Full=Glutamine amidotransferase PurL; AltName: Full=Phosphoribosylformylglycinamidine synthase subunit II [Caldivirga maquilingensis IC-167]ABW01508.1 phosphoribosylformylglycinam
MGLTSDEAKIIINTLGRNPTEAEWLIFEAEWSEHCSYKSSRAWIRLLPSKSPLVIRGSGLDAPIIRINNIAVTFKIESHNHPSAVDPYDGAATGVGGIVRDILTTGLRPIALLDNLHLGSLDNQRSLWLSRNIIKGISDYGNRIGVPVVGGETWFDESFNNNPIVLVTCIGAGDFKRVIWGEGKVGDLVLVVGNDTGRDGMLGSSFASRELSSSDDIGAVQVGNPLLEKLLIDALMELGERGLVKAIKDVGGGGLATALSELAHQLGLGIEVDLTNIRLRDELKPEEILVSESQERMIIVVDPSRLSYVEAVLRKYEVGFDLIGKLTNDGKFTAYYKGIKLIDLPLDLITNPPEPIRKYTEPVYLMRLRRIPPLPSVKFNEALIKVASSPNLASKEVIYTQYDYEVGVRTVIKPGRAGATVLRLLEEDGGDGKLGIAVKADSNPRYSYLNPFTGAANSLAKAYRNVASVGAKPIAAVDSINVGNPEKPDKYWYFVKTVEGLTWMGNALGIPFVGGKVSFYNEDSVTGASIKPVVAVAVLGVVNDYAKAIEGGLTGEGWLVIIGDTGPELGGSEFLHSVHGLVAGEPPEPKPLSEVKNANLVMQLINNGLAKAVMDVGVGGLAAALIKMSIIGGVGFTVDLSKAPLTQGLNDPVTVAFSETNARYIIETSNLKETVRIIEANGVPYGVLGESGGGIVQFKWGGLELASLSVDDLVSINDSLRGVI